MSFTSLGNRFWLLFPLVQDGAGKRLCYGSPLVINRTTGIEQPLPWQDAISWIEQGLPDLEHENDREWAEIMIKVAASEGGLPDEISPIIGGESKANAGQGGGGQPATRPEWK